MGGRGAASRGIARTNSGLFSGTPGTYTLYRAGDLDVRQGIIFLAADEEKAKSYSGTTFDNQGNQIIRDVNSWDIDIRNPLIIDADMDTVALRSAWLALHPDKTNEDYRKKIGRNGLTATSWQRIDKENGTALAKSKYDAVIYRNPNTGKVREVWVHRNRKKDFRKR